MPSTERRVLFTFQKNALAILSRNEIHLALTAPTGAGKGVVIERLAECEEERILLLTPLVALGRQQVNRFIKAGIPIRASLGRKTMETCPSPRVWITSPEAAMMECRKRAIKSWRPTLIAVDEAHCISDWGDHFRPAYGNLISFIQSLEAKRTLWMSATFPRATLESLRQSIPGNWICEGTFALPGNLQIHEKRILAPERIEAVRSSVLEKSSAGILFVGTRNNVARYRNLLEPLGKSLMPYHAGMSDEERRNIERKLECIDRDLPVPPSIVATNAFGMGMDYPHLSWVTLASIPYSLLSLMQSFGRVGRAGRFGEAELFWTEEDFRFSGFFATRGGSDGKGVRDLKKLRQYLESNSAEKTRILGEEFL
ncbi:MAG: ATP-dependent DNA helicase RecQ [Cryobacterium sp.]|nr:ATP-dependent DNA helicase RecQ [Oligoflexia bacterium]